MPTHWKRSHDHIAAPARPGNPLTSDNSPQTLFEPNSVWLCFTDSVLHAALAGRYALEQTFEITIDDMAHREVTAADSGIADGPATC
jgi:hypothetical protein